MRNKILLKLAFICVFSHFAHCQNPNSPSIVHLDFKSKKFVDTDFNTIKKGDFYQVQIDCINLNLYNVSIEKKDSNYVSNITFPNIEMLGVDQITKLSSSIISSTSSSVRSRLQTAKKTIEDYQAVIKAHNLQIEELNSDRKFISDSLGKLSKKGFLPDSIQAIEKLELKKDLSFIDVKVEFAKEEVRVMNFEIDSLKRWISIQEIVIAKSGPDQLVLDLIAENKNEIKLKLTSSKSVFEEINKMVSSLTLKGLTYLESLNEKNESSLFISNEEIQFNQIQRNSKNYRDQIDERIDEIVKIDTSFSQLKRLDKDVFEKNQLVKKASEELTLLIKESKAVLEKEVSKISETKINEFLIGLINFENNSERQYLSLPIQHNGDLNQLKVEITPKKPEYGPSYKVEYQFPAKKFYAGIGGGFYYATSMRNDVYSSREEKVSDSISDFYVVNENQKKGEIGFNTLLHVGTKLFNCNSSGGRNLFGLHATVGPSISLNASPQLRLSTGVGFSIGKERNMMTIDLLTMTGYVQRLSNVFEEGVAYNLKPEQPTVSKLRSSFAIGLGYIYKF